MKNTFVVTMTLLLLGTLAGSVVGYKKATAPQHETAAHAPAADHTAESPAANTTENTAANTTENTETANATAAGSPAATGSTASAAPQDTTGTGVVDGQQAGTEADQTAQGEAQTGTTNAGTTANAGTPGVDNTNAAGETGNAPADTASAANANEPTGDPAVGQAKFAAACAACHGQNAEGGAVGPKLSAVKDWTLAQFKTSLRDAKTPTKALGAPMMRFDTAAVSDDEIAGMYAWLKTVN